MAREVRWKAMRPGGVLHAYGWIDYDMLAIFERYRKTRPTREEVRVLAAARRAGGRVAGVSVCGRKTAMMHAGERRCRFCRWCLLPNGKRGHGVGVRADGSKI